jgi:G6PDH family F420-dependent oxidoreductase
VESHKQDVRFGCFLPIPASPVDKLLKIAKTNEEADFDSIWFADHLLFIPPRIVPDAWSVLAATAVFTERAVLGTCVSDPHRYHPAVFAQKVATTDRISGGRVILGLGAGEAMNLEPFGIEWKNPVSRLVEAVTIMRRLWSGEMLTFEGRFWKLKDAFLQISPVNGTVPIYFGANSPRTFRLTGEIADGWLSVPLSPKLYEERLKFVKDGAEKAEDAYKQINTIKPQVLPSPQMLKDAGYHIELPKELASLSYFKALADTEWIERFVQYGELIPLEAAIEFSIAGTPEDCIKKIEEYIEAGVKHFLLLNVGPDPRQVLNFYSKEIIPYFKRRC